MLNKNNENKNVPYFFVETMFYFCTIAILVRTGGNYRPMCVYIFWMFINMHSLFPVNKQKIKNPLQTIFIQHSKKKLEDSFPLFISINQERI